MFEINGLVNSIGCATIGKSLQVIDVARTFNDRGDLDPIETNYNIDGIVQIVDANDDVVKEGILQPKDIICFFDDSQVNYFRLKNDNRILYDSIKYRIVDCIQEIGHTEVHAKKL
jgi:hypothetical protein